MCRTVCGERDRERERERERERREWWVRVECVYLAVDDAVMRGEIKRKHEVAAES